MARFDKAPQTTKAALEARRVQALDLRKSGLSYRDIGLELGVSYETARKDVMLCLRRLAKEQQGKTNEFRSLELERLDTLWRSLWVTATSGKPESLDAIDRLLRITKQRAALLGLDTPVRQPVELTGRDGGAIKIEALTDDDLIAIIAKQTGE